MSFSSRIEHVFCGLCRRAAAVSGPPPLPAGGGRVASQLLAGGRCPPRLVFISSPQTKASEHVTRRLF